MNSGLSIQNLYRLPWNLNDNSISWLEPTYKCNIICDGCYRENREGSHKSLDDIQHELDVFEKYRKTDGVSIAGGEPLTHPEIVEIVRMVRRKGWKPVINTNGMLLSEELLAELHKAGVIGFTFHIDSGQNRPGWKGKNEIELNELRLLLAEMLARYPNLSCSFNATIYPENIQYVPEMIAWAQEHIDKVHVMVFILYRMVIVGSNASYYAGEKLIDFDKVGYSKEDDDRRIDVTSYELVDFIRKEIPDFSPSAYLNGTVTADSLKWLLTGRMGNKHRIFGYTGPKFMELVQIFKHFFTGSYLAYSEIKWLHRGRIYFIFSIFDKGIRNIAKNYFKSLLVDPKAFFSRVHHQAIMIIQPGDAYKDGTVNMCDGCPDMTVWNNKLVWSCRMEEQMRWGQNVRCVPEEEGD